VTPPADHDDLTVHDASFSELVPDTLYEILRLRVDVFVVEQECAFGDVDGRDREPGCRHLWIERAGEVVGYARILAEPDGSTQIGRVVTRLDVRDRRVGVRLMSEALARVQGTVVLKAQARLAGWYGQFGFVTEGPEFEWDGIPHVRMIATVRS
jgi:ElaA protein